MADAKDIEQLNRIKPIVFMFTPERYEVVTGERVQEWERLMRERVGLQQVGIDIAGLRPSLPTLCFCGGFGNDACDCDSL
jgi:hypothetical protein